MLLKKSALAVAVVALGVTAGAVSASAQQSCTGYYNQVMGYYQTLGPSSPQYNQMANDYSARCLSGASAANPGYYQQPANPGYYQQPYGYQPVDPAAAVVGAAIVGGVVGAALDGDHQGYRGYDGRYDGRRW